MATNEPGRAPAALTSLPRLDDLPTSEQGYDRERVAEAFEAFRRHVTSLQAHLRVLQAAPKPGITEPSGHAVRMDALHLVRSAAEFADVIERDAQEAAAKQVARAEQEIRENQLQLQEREAEIARIRQETERQRVEILNAARNEARDILMTANRDATQELREAEARGSRLLEQSRHQATELTNSARSEVDATLEWARAQADVVVQRARLGAEQLLSAAGHGDPAIHEAVDAIVRAAEAEGRRLLELRDSRGTPPAAVPTPTPPPAPAPPPPVGHEPPPASRLGGADEPEEPPRDVRGDDEL
jgi:DNA repair exonuclease SbcCD ATPase subunit